MDNWTKVIVHGRKTIVFQRWFCYSKLNYLSCEALPDIGATSSVVTSALVEKHGLQKHIRRLPPNVQLKAANNYLIPLRGHISLCVTANGHSSMVNALVSEDLSEVFFLSWHDLLALCVLPPDFPNAIVSQLVSPSATASSAIEKLKVDFEDILGDKLDISVGKGCPPHDHSFI